MADLKEGLKDKELPLDIEKGHTTGEAQLRTALVWPSFSWMRRLFFFDVDRLIAHGYRTRLEVEDMWKEKSVATGLLVERFEPALAKQRARQVVEAAELREKLAELGNKGRPATFVAKPTGGLDSPLNSPARSTLNGGPTSPVPPGTPGGQASPRVTHNGSAVAPLPPPAVAPLPPTKGIGSSPRVTSNGSMTTLLPPIITGAPSTISRSPLTPGAPPIIASGQSGVTSQSPLLPGAQSPRASAGGAGPATPNGSRLQNVTSGGGAAPSQPAPTGAPAARGGKAPAPAPGKKQKKPKLPRHEQKRADLEKKLDRATKNVDLKRVVLAGNVPALVGTGVLYLVAQACSLAGPLLLQRIVAGLQCRGPTCEPKSTLYYYCIGLFMAPFIQAICENHQNYVLFLAGTRMRNALMAAIYRKCLNLSNSSLQEESAGRVVTLMSNDAQKLQDAMMAIHAMWGSPCYIVAVLVLLYQQVGWATFVGLAVMLTLAPSSGKLATKLGQLRRAMLQWTDKRVGYMNEVISGIQMIKFYAWEKPFSDKVEGARGNEAAILRASAAWQSVFAMLLFSGPVLVAIFCFGAWAIAGNVLTNANAYAALALFGLLRFPMSFLPMLITMVVNALVALKRIGAFLTKEESSLSKEVLDVNHPVGDVLIEGGEFSWDLHDPVSTLVDVNLQAKTGSLTMVVGGVGSGKSSVLGALVGHMSKRSGRAKVGGRVAYVAQQAWIMNDTLQENVLLGGEVMDPERYKMALKVSCLGPDLEILPNGDVTEIGDRGVTLSGGQKQRVSIARAVYADPDVYLLDDPLSAVDSHVGRELFEKCIRGPMRNKTVVLVTNALQYLPQADNILWMEDGRIRAQGSYAELVEQGLNIAELNHEGDDDDSVEEEKPPAFGGMLANSVMNLGMSTDAIKLSELRKRVSRENSRISREREVVPSSRMSKEFGASGGAAFGKVTLTRAASMANRNLTGVEEREAGNLSFDVVKRYVSGGGGAPVVMAIVCLYTLEQGARVYTDRWVGVWFSNLYNQTTAFYLGMYFGLGVFYSILTCARTLRFLFMCVNATVNLHNALLNHLLLLPKSFFDTNPSGRILNRFSRDTDIMDSTLPQSLIQFCSCVATYISILIVISIATKWFALGLLPLTVIYFYIQRYYIPTARELQRIESISRSPIYSKFQEALAGVCTIRAYRKEQHFTEVSDALMETNANAFMTQKLAAAWLAMRLDLMGLAVLTGCGVLVIAGNVDPGLAGLALVYALDLTRFLKHGTNMASKSEADFNSVERIVQYLRPETEAAPDTLPEVAKVLMPEWPTLGTLEVVDLTMRYRPEMPLVLRGVSFRIEGGEKVGLVGRTGSGKSSIFLALFRMVEPTSGRVMIDGIDTRLLGVRHLRSQMSIIPQDPFMFSGTVRTNLDPFEQNTDARLWEVIEAVGLKVAITNMNGGLGARVVDNGANFSLGQRQLFCMARAMLRNSKLLMLDEATASVDVDTDALIQFAIRSVFASCTLLTIAHRLNTIMDSDKVLVLDAGKVVEYAHADDLLKSDNGIFTGMVSQTGKSTAKYLRSLASSARWSQTSGMAPELRTGMSFNSVGKSFNARSFSARSSFKEAGSLSQRPSFRQAMTPSRLGPAPYLVDEDDMAEIAEEQSMTAGQAASSTKPSRLAGRSQSPVRRLGLHNTSPTRSRPATDEASSPISSPATDLHVAIEQIVPGPMGPPGLSEDGTEEGTRGPSHFSDAQSQREAEGDVSSSLSTPQRTPRPSEAGGGPGQSAVGPIVWQSNALSGEKGEPEDGSDRDSTPTQSHAGIRR